MNNKITLISTIDLKHCCLTPILWFESPHQWCITKDDMLEEIWEEIMILFMIIVYNTIRIIHSDALWLCYLKIKSLHKKYNIKGPNRIIIQLTCNEWFYICRILAESRIKSCLVNKMTTERINSGSDSIQLRQVVVGTCYKGNCVLLMDDVHNIVHLHRMTQYLPCKAQWSPKSDYFAFVRGETLC